MTTGTTQTTKTITLAVNDSLIQWPLREAALNLSTFLRDHLHLKGSKIVCAEGDCGACSVLVDREGDGQYEVVNSCILPMLLLEGAHVVTIEGLSEKYPEHPVRLAMIQSMGSQCGFCTPGFMVTLSKMYEQAGGHDKTPSRETIKVGCSGHLCRCTGYQDILDAATDALSKRIPQQKLKEVFAAVREKIFSQRPQEAFYQDDQCFYALPTTLAKACEWKAQHSNVRLLGGATDLGVEANKREVFYQAWMSLKNVKDLSDIQKQADGTIRIGANATLTEIRRAIKKDHPEFAEFLLTFASPNIRHAGTLVGNLVTASPIGDSLPYLMVMGARVHLASTQGERILPIEDFIQGYRKTALRTDELVSHLSLLPRAKNATVQVVKVSKREHMDISTLSMAARAKLRDGRLRHFAVAFGGLAATVDRITTLEQQFEGRLLTEILAQPIDLSAFYQPMNDHRGSSRYRLKVAENLLGDFLQMLHDTSVAQSVSEELL